MSDIVDRVNKAYTFLQAHRSPEEVKAELQGLILFGIDYHAKPIKSVFACKDCGTTQNIIYVKDGQYFCSLCTNNNRITANKDKCWNCGDTENLRSQENALGDISYLCSKCLKEFKEDHIRGEIEVEERSESSE